MAARILIGTFPVVGHLTPFLPLVRALVARGHEVTWNCSEAFRQRIEDTGARFAPLEHARDWSNFQRGDLVPGGGKLTGVAALKVDLKYGFIANAPSQLRDLEEIACWFRPDLLLCDPGFIGGLFYHELHGTPLAVLNVLPMMLSSRDTAPYGIGMAPSATTLGRLRNRTLQWAVEHILFRDVQRHWNAARAKLNLPPTGWIMDTPARASLYLQATVPGFEYPRPDLPAHVHFLGQLSGAMPPADWQPPSWWNEVRQPDDSRSVVHVTQGTLANASPLLIAPALEGLAEEKDLLIVVSTGGRSPESLELKVPANARVATFLPYSELLPRTSVMVTNGGYGGTQLALSHGVPLAVAGTTEDKLEVSARVAWSGAGLNLNTDAPTPGQVRDAVRLLLWNGRYRERARTLQAEYRQYDAVERATGLLEQLAATGPRAQKQQASSSVR